MKVWDEFNLPPVSGGATPSTGPVVPKPSLEDKIVEAARESETIAAAFSPAAAVAIEAGVEVEPLVSNLLKLIIGHFRHKTTPKPGK